MWTRSTRTGKKVSTGGAALQRGVIHIFLLQNRGIKYGIDIKIVA
jgi:hypothetical protein